MEMATLSAIEEARSKLAEDIMWARDDLRATLLEQARELKRLQAVVWVLTQLTADKLGVSSDDLAARIAKALQETDRK